MTDKKDGGNGKDNAFHCSFVSIHYIICECGDTFPSEEDLRVHLEEQHPHKRERKEYKCGVCGQIYNDEEECIQHYEEQHMVSDYKTEESDREAECPEYEDDNKDGILLEEDQGDDIWQEEEQDNEMLLEEDQRNMLKIEHDVAMKVEPGEQVVYMVETEQEKPNMDTGVEKVKKGKKKINVEPGEQVVYMVETEQEKPNTDTGVEKVKKRKKKHPPPDIVCEVCGKIYNSNAALKYHQRVHTGERPYQCALCPKRFTMPLFLQIHIRTHTGERPYPCLECPKRFSNRAALMRHERVHTGEKPYPCPMCDKHFTQSNSMKLHVTTVHLKQPAPYKSKNRKLKAESRSPNVRASKPKNPEVIGTEEVLRNGLERYILGPLKNDIEMLKNEQDSLKYEMVESEILYDDEKNCFEIVYEEE